MRPLKKYKTGFRVRIEDFFGNNSHQAKRSQIRLSERKRVPNLQCSEMQNCRKNVVEQRGTLFYETSE
jgi:hypothetical protein